MPEKVMVFRFSALGDVAMTYPVLKVFSETYPDYQIIFVSRPFFKPVFENLGPVRFIGIDVDKNYKGINGLYALYKELRQEKPSQIIDLHDVLRTKVLRTFFRYSDFPVFKIDKGRKERKKLIKQPLEKLRPLKSVHERYADVFRKAGFSIDLKKFEPVKPALSHEVKIFLKIFDGQKIIGIAPLAKHIGKQYPLGGTREIIEILLQNRKDISIFLFGAPSEKKLLDTLITDPDRVFNLAGIFQFSEELQIISRLHLMFSMDSGNGHLAANYGIPVITVWGVTHPYAGFAPFGQKSSQQILPDIEKFPMLPCSIYGNKICKGYEKIWDDILPEKVAEVILQNL